MFSDNKPFKQELLLCRDILPRAKDLTLPFRACRTAYANDVEAFSKVSAWFVLSWLLKKYGYATWWTLWKWQAPRRCAKF